MKVQKEIETIKGRAITLNLSDTDCKRLSEKAGHAGLTIGVLLESFIGDLVEGTYSNGSDERMYANKWYNRCGYGIYSSDKNLLKWLMDEWRDIEEFLDLVDEIKEGKETLEDYKSHPEDYDEEEIGYLKSDLEDWENEYHDIIHEFVKEHPEADLEKEIEDCREWLREQKKMLESR